jgi:3-dehydroquinate dehydratase-2
MATAASTPAAGRPRPAVVVIHGPNLDLLGRRQPEIYGRTTLAEIDDSLRTLGGSLGVDVECHQTNREGAIIEMLHDAGARSGVAGVIVNPGGYTHTSIAIADALAALDVPAVEVHLSNLYAREPERHTSRTAAPCRGVIMGLGPDSYLLALRHLVDTARAATLEPRP